MAVRFWLSYTLCRSHWHLSFPEDLALYPEQRPLRRWGLRCLPQPIPSPCHQDGKFWSSSPGVFAELLF
jgi:hypothetical protein